MSVKGKYISDFPLLVEEFHYEKNKPLLPKDLRASSHSKIWWIGKKCNHEFESILSSIKNESAFYVANHFKADTLDKNMGQIIASNSIVYLDSLSKQEKIAACITVSSHIRRLNQNLQGHTDSHQTRWLAILQNHKQYYQKYCYQNYHYRLLG